MNGGQFVCLVEGRSDGAMLQEIIHQLTKRSKEDILCISFDGKRNLQKRIERKLKFYEAPNCVFLIMCDQDIGACEQLKEELQSKIPADKKRKAKIRIACRELESFYLGDLHAVGKAFDMPKLAQKQNTLRTPDDTAKPARKLQTLTKNKYQKTSGSRKIAPHLRLDGSNKSKSFNALLEAIKELHGILLSNTSS